MTDNNIEKLEDTENTNNNSLSILSGKHSNQILSNKRSLRMNEDNSKELHISNSHNSHNIKNNSSLLNNKKKSDNNNLQLNDNNHNEEFLLSFLKQINRENLDFDFEKKCSITHSKLNIYSCLICGKYLQGISHNTVAYTHSLENNHSLFINLNNQKVFLLPELKEIDHDYLTDIKKNLNPLYLKEDLEILDSDVELCYALDGKEFVPGSVGLNNIRNTDYANVIFQSLSKIKIIRDYFLCFNNELLNSFFVLRDNKESVLFQKISELIKKMYNRYNFKSHICPHEIMQAVVDCSSNMFKIIEKSDPILFLSWLLNIINNFENKFNKLILKNKINNKLEKNHKSSKNKVSIVNESFEGQLLIETYTEITESNIKEIVLYDSVIQELNGKKVVYTSKQQKFYYLTLELPNTPLFKESNEKISIPQVSIFSLLEKYNGEKLSYSTNDPNTLIRYTITHFPKNLVLFYKRFKSNSFFTEKNNTIINFPLKGLKLPFKSDENSEITYDLISNIIHEGKKQDGFYKLQTKQHRNNEEWIDIQDLNITNILPQDVVVSESYIHFYEGHQE